MRVLNIALLALRTFDWKSGLTTELGKMAAKIRNKSSMIGFTVNPRTSLTIAT